MSKQLIIYAPQIHRGGSAVLLNEILSVAPIGFVLIAIIDERHILNQNCAKEWNIKRISPSTIGRLSAELMLSRDAKDTDVTLCFGNLPPMFKLGGRVVLFVGTRYFVDDLDFGSGRILINLKFFLQRCWLKLFLRNCSSVTVQTESMSELFKKKVSSTINVEILPMFPGGVPYRRLLDSDRSYENKEFTFVYPAGGREPEELHKNHRVLLEAFCILAKEKIFPKLQLTIDRHTVLAKHINYLKERDGINVTNYGTITHSEVMRLYNQADALVFPSTTESFGMPLIEARYAKIPILASELDYVRDLVDPEQTFDPKSPKSIARAVKRFMSVGDKDVCPESVESFLSWVLDDKNLFW